MSRKRKAELSPIKNDRAKRSALGNLTNALFAADSDEKATIVPPQTAGKKPLDDCLKLTEDPQNQTALKTQPPISSRTRGAAKVHSKKSTKTSVPTLQPAASVHSKSKAVTANVPATIKSFHVADVPVKTSRRISNEFENTGESLYVSALEEIPAEYSRVSETRCVESSADETLLSEDDKSGGEDDVAETCSGLPLGVEDFDKENWNDPYQVSNYARDIFDYLKQREIEYKIKDYMSEQPELSKWMRSLLVDWMVEVVSLQIRNAKFNPLIIPSFSKNRSSSTTKPCTWP